MEEKLCGFSLKINLFKNNKKCKLVVVISIIIIIIIIITTATTSTLSSSFYCMYFSHNFFKLNQTFILL